MFKQKSCKNKYSYPTVPGHPHVPKSTDLKSLVLHGTVFAYNLHVSSSII